MQPIEEDELEITEHGGSRRQSDALNMNKSTVREDKIELEENDVEGEGEKEAPVEE